MSSFLCFLAIFAALVILSYGHQYSPEGWEAASKYLKQTMDETVDPCDDFHSFVCGNMEKEYGNEFDTENQRVFDQLRQKILSLIETVNVDDDATPTFKKSVKTFYHQCNSSNFSDWKSFTHEMYETLQKYLLPNIDEEINNKTENSTWNSGTDAAFWKFVGTLQRELRISFLLSAELDSVEDNCAVQPMLHIRPSTFQRISFSTERLIFILNQIVSGYHNISISEEDVNDTVNEILSFQESFVYFANDIAMNSVSKNIKIKYKEVETYFPGVHWSAYFDGLLPSELKETWLSSNPTIIIRQDISAENLTNFLNQHDRITVTNYGFLLILAKYHLYFDRGLQKSVSESSYSIYSDNCLDLSVRYFGAAVLHLLTEKYGINVENWRNDVIMMKETVFSAFRFLIHSTDWLSGEEKMKFIEKANNIVFYGGIPKWITSDEAVESKTPKYNSSLSLVQNEILAQKKLFKEQLRPLITGLMDDAPPTFLQNAFHNPIGTSRVELYIGIHLPPYYMYTYPLAVKYGLLGSVLGHELMHGFGTLMTEDYSAYFGNYTRLNLNSDTLNTMSERMNCSIPMYDTYCSNMTSCEIGKRTKEENTADIEGLRTAYLAYKFVLQTLGGEPLLENLVDYSSDQIFFISYAKQFCTIGNVTDDMFGWHSADKARLEQPLMNFPPFAKAFNCPLGSRYSRNKTCYLYGNNIWNEL